MKKNIIIIILTVIILLLFGIICFQILNKKEEKKEWQVVIGKIVNISDKHFTVSDNSGLYYNIYSDTNYEIGDTVAIYSIEPVRESNPVQVTPSRIELLEKKFKDNEEDIQSKDDTNNENNSEIPPIGDNQGNTTNKYTENDVVTLFQELNYDLDKSSNSEKIKKNFVLCVDFLFYDGEINNYKFKDLTEASKLKVLQIMMSIDNKIDSKFPGYKETIKDTPINLRNKIVEKYLELTTEFCKNNEETCILAKKGLSDMKKSFGLTWDFIKNITNIGISKLNDWYQIWKET